MIERVLPFGSKPIRYELTRSGRKTLGITVTPELRVLVNAPFDASDQKIESVIRKRARWIFKHLDNFLIYHPKQPPRRYVGGETHLYMGRQYTLRIYRGKTESVKLIGRELRVVCKDKEDVESLVMQWYAHNAGTRIRQIAVPWLKHFEDLGITHAGIQLRRMRSRWGSCARSKRIILNPELIKAPKGSIECVIVHELCHLVHPNHSKAFYELHSRIMPGWEKWKDRLERLPISPIDPIVNRR